MKPEDAEVLARRLMAEHGLGDWPLIWNRSRYAFGSCFFGIKPDRKGRYCRGPGIALSEPLVMANTEDHVRETILHEIAHGLAGGGHNHDEKWREAALSIGCNGTDNWGSEPGIQWVAYLGNWRGPLKMTVADISVSESAAPDKERIEKYFADIKSGMGFESVIVSRRDGEYRLVEGIDRYYAAVKAGLTAIPVRFKKRTKRHERGPGAGSAVQNIGAAMTAESPLASPSAKTDEKGQMRLF